MTIQELTQKLKKKAIAAGLNVVQINVTHAEYYVDEGLFSRKGPNKHGLSCTTFYQVENVNSNFTAMVPSYMTDGPKALLVEYDMELKNLARVQITATSKPTELEL
jgi:hypothetical protein